MKKNHAGKIGCGTLFILGIVCMIIGLICEVVIPEYSKLFSHDFRGYLLAIVLFPAFLVLLVIAFFIFIGSIFGGGGGSWWPD